LNFILGNWIVFMNNISTHLINVEINNSVNILLESKIKNNKLQIFSNSIINFFFFLVFFMFWILLFMIILSSYSL
jgi:hypothetical protein